MPVYHPSIAAKLSGAQRTLLLDHVDGTAPIQISVQPMVRAKLIELGLIAYDGHGVRPTHTRITADGRQVLSLMLAEYAEALIRAGYEVTGKDSLTGPAPRFASRPRKDKPTWPTTSPADAAATAPASAPIT